MDIQASQYERISNPVCWPILLSYIHRKRSLEIISLILTIFPTFDGDILFLRDSQALGDSLARLSRSRY